MKAIDQETGAARTCKHSGVRVTTNSNQPVALHTEAYPTNPGVFYPNLSYSFLKGVSNYGSSQR